MKWELIKNSFIFVFCVILLILILKACEIIPKVLRNPLLVGRTTTIIFSIIILTRGFLYYVSRINFKHLKFYNLKKGIFYNPIIT
jgi:hypothetical protein